MHLAAVITYLKYKPAWLQLLVFGLITVGTTFILWSVVDMVINALYRLKPEELREPDFSNSRVLHALRWKQCLITISLFFVSGFFFAYKSDQRPWRFLGVRKPQPAYFTVLGVVLILAAFPLAAWLADVNDQVHLPASLKQMEQNLRDSHQKLTAATLAMLKMRSFGEYLAVMLMSALLPAFCEEIFFRSVLQRIFIQITTRPLLGIVITGCLFSLFHEVLLGFLPRAMLGVLLGMLYWYSGSIWPAVAAHFVHNAIQITAYYVWGEDKLETVSFSPLLVAGSLLALLAIGWYMRRISVTHYGEWYDTDDDLVLPAQKDEPPNQQP
ncbi:MAG: CPBP family intramembrane metalloprotease [Flavihumibacter sp.]